MQPPLGKIIDKLAISETMLSDELSNKQKTTSEVVNIFK